MRNGLWSINVISDQLPGDFLGVLGSSGLTVLEPEEDLKQCLGLRKVIARARVQGDPRVVEPYDVVVAVVDHHVDRYG